MNPYKLKNVFQYLTSNNQLLKKKLKLGTSEIPIPPKRQDVIDVEVINRFSKANPRVDTTNLKPLSVKQSNVKKPDEPDMQVKDDGFLDEALGDYNNYLGMRKARPPKKRYKEIPFKKFLGEYSKENRADGGRAGYEDGGMLVQPSDDGSRPGYKEDNKYTSSKGTPGVKLDAKQIKNVQDDLVNFDGLSLTKKGNSYYIRFRLQKGKNKISKAVTATPENIALVKKEQKQFMKTNYPNVLSSANFENLRMQETNINLSAKDFAEVLNNKNKTTINGLPWTKDTVQKLQGDLKLNSYVQPGGASGKLRPINDAKKIVKGFNPEELKRLNQIPDINLRNAAIRSKANSITGRISYIKKNRYSTRNN